MDDEQLTLEVDWCLGKLEEKLAGMDPYSRPAQEAAKVHRILKSSKAPLIKKRQAMRNMFGDYRAKMKAEQKKSLAAMKKSKLVAVKEPPSQSKFIRRSAGAQKADGPVNSATSDFSQLSVDGAHTQSDSQTGAETGSESGNIASAPAGSSQSQGADGEFRFGFDGSEGSAGEGSVQGTSVVSNGDAKRHNHFVMKPAGEEFRFNFQVDGDEK